MCIKKQYYKIFLFNIILLCFFILTGFDFGTIQKDLGLAETQIKDKKYTKAEEILNSVLKNLDAPIQDIDKEQQDIAKNILIPQIYYALGEIQYKQAKYDEAKTYYEKVINYPAKSFWNVKALHHSGMSNYFQKKYKEAREVFSRLINEYQKTSEAAEGQYYSALSYEMENNIDNAKESYKKFLLLYPDHMWAEKFREKLKQ